MAPHQFISGHKIWLHKHFQILFFTSTIHDIQGANSTIKTNLLSWFSLIDKYITRHNSRRTYLTFWPKQFLTKKVFIRVPTLEVFIHLPFVINASNKTFINLNNILMPVTN